MCALMTKSMTSQKAESAERMEAVQSARAYCSAERLSEGGGEEEGEG